MALPLTHIVVARRSVAEAPEVVQVPTRSLGTGHRDAHLDELATHLDFLSIAEL